MTPLVLKTGLLTGRADIPVIITAQIKISSDIKYQKLNLVTNRIQRRDVIITREGFLRKNIVAVSFFQKCAIYPYS